jgi:hypothetical protein
MHACIHIIYTFLFSKVTPAPPLLEQKLQEGMHEKKYELKKNKVTPAPPLLEQQV